MMSPQTFTLALPGSEVSRHLLRSHKETQRSQLDPEPNFLLCPLLKLLKAQRPQRQEEVLPDAQPLAPGLDSKTQQVPGLK